jgi:hypothetical protein
MSTADLKITLGLIEEAEVAALLHMTLPSLRNQRARNQGPPYQRIGRKVFYPLDQLKKYLAASTVTPAKAATLIDGNRRRRRSRAAA